MENFLSSFGMVSIEMPSTERIELKFIKENDENGEAEAEMAMQEYLDSLAEQENGKFGKNEVGRAEEYEHNLYVADVY